MPRLGFFDLGDRFKKDARDPLADLNQLIDWESFRPTLNKTREKIRKSNAGRKPYDAALMLKGNL